MGLVDDWRNSQKKYKTGGVSLACLDDESLDKSEYGRMGDRTIVPRSREEGGIEGLPLGNDCKYGVGVLRRKLVDDGNGGFKVDEEIHNFRPDQADEEELDMFSEQELEAAGVELEHDLQKQAMDLMLQTPKPSGNGHHASASTDPQAPNAMMLQMMTMMSTMMQNQQQAPKPQAKKPVDPGVNVVFSGEFGKMKVRYAAVVVEPEFLVLISNESFPAMYEPPINPNKPLGLTVSGTKHNVLSLGLSFTHKGDILLLMPMVSERIENAEEEQQ